MRLINSRTATIAVAGVLLVGVGAGGATAAQMIDGSEIKAGTIGIGKLKPGLVDRINQPGAQGPVGSRGPQGPAGPQGAKGDSNVTVVSNLSGSFKARAGDEAGLKMTGDGVQFGPFANGGACEEAGSDYARLDFSGMNGKSLSSLTNLAYTAWYVADTDTGGVGSPTMRVSFQDGSRTSRLTFSPNTQFNKAFNYDDAQGAMHTWLVTHGTVRLNDDSGDNPAGEKPWSTFASEYGANKITNIDIINGCQNGTNLQSVVREIEVNGTHYEFGSN